MTLMLCKSSCGKYLVDVEIECDKWGQINLQIPKFIELIVPKAFEKSLYEMPETELYISLMLTDEDSIRVINRDYRGIDKPTDVISLEMHEDSVIDGKSVYYTGDIILSYENLLRDSQEVGRTIAQHSTFLIIHGLLHLLGHDHQEDDEAEVMESAELELYNYAKKYLT